MSSKRVKDLPVSLENYDDVEAVIDGLSYDGFNPELIRRTFHRNKTSDDIVDDILTCLIAYMMVGNNIDKLTSKVSNEDIGMKIKRKLKTIGVKAVAKGNSDVTLPRSAISFIPAYYLLRLLYEKKLQNQTSSRILVRYKDIVFAGVPVIWNMTGYKEYYFEFGKLIASKERDNNNLEASMDIDDESGINHWVEIAQNGYASDHLSNSIMDKALSIRSESVSFEDVRSTIVKIMRIHFPEFDDEGSDNESSIEDKQHNLKRARITSGKAEIGEVDE